MRVSNATKLNEQAREEVNALYEIFTREIEAHKVVEKLIKNLPSYLAHTKENNQQLQKEIERLSQTFLLSDTEPSHVKELQAELSAQEDVVLNAVEDSSETKQAYSVVQEELEAIQERLKEIEDEQISLGEALAEIEKDYANARQKVNIYANKLHTIKRYMEKRNLPGIPDSFLEIFFSTSNNIEELVKELEATRVNIESVNRWLEILGNDMEQLEEETYRIVQDATLTEQLLQYSNRYRSFDDNVQAAFNKSLYVFEHDYDYAQSLEIISKALDLVEPGVTERFVTSYEKTRENIRF